MQKYCSLNCCLVSEHYIMCNNSKNIILIHPDTNISILCSFTLHTQRNTLPTLAASSSPPDAHVQRPLWLAGLESWPYLCTEPLWSEWRIQEGGHTWREDRGSTWDDTKYDILNRGEGKREVYTLIGNAISKVTPQAEQKQFWIIVYDTIWAAGLICCNSRILSLYV